MYKIIFEAIALSKKELKTQQKCYRLIKKNENTTVKRYKKNLKC